MFQSVFSFGVQCLHILCALNLCASKQLGLSPFEKLQEKYFQTILLFCAGFQRGSLLLFLEHRGAEYFETSLRQLEDQQISGKSPQVWQQKQRLVAAIQNRKYTVGTSCSSFLTPHPLCQIQVTNMFHCLLKTVLYLT